MDKNNHLTLKEMLGFTLGTTNFGTFFGAPWAYTSSSTYMRDDLTFPGFRQRKVIRL
jgi:hypothetical protein